MVSCLTWTRGQISICVDLSSGIFIDNSGSTSSRLPATNRSIIESELSLCQLKKFDHIVAWSTTATICRDLSRLPAQGGTDPTSIFTNPKTKAAFDASDVVVFVTDGEIPAPSVTRLGQLTENHLSKSLIVCVIVNQRLGRRSTADGVERSLSVLRWRNILHSVVERSDRYEDLNTVDLAELFANVRLCGCEKVPSGYFPLRETTEEMVAMNFSEFLRQDGRKSVRSFHD